MATLDPVSLKVLVESLCRRLLLLGLATLAAESTALAALVLSLLASFAALLSGSLTLLSLGRALLTQLGGRNFPGAFVASFLDLLALITPVDLLALTLRVGTSTLAPTYHKKAA